MTNDDHTGADEPNNDQLLKELERYKEVASRSQAELLNAKARMEKEAGELRKFVAEGVILKLLPTIDNLQRAIQHLPEDLQKNEWVKGVVSTEQQLLKELESLGLRRFESLGQTIDSEKHEVLMQGAGETGMVIEVLSDGYELNGKVIRPAKVKAGGG
ncbi:MAG: nucleotide exchange factor GrpE [Candidatus Peribacteraceae bacterium]